MTERQVHLARLALGLPNRFRTSYRNRYVGDAGLSDYKDWRAIADAGLATESYFGESGHSIFELTKEGATAVLLPKEKLDTEDFPTAVAREKEGKRG